MTVHKNLATIALLAAAACGGGGGGGTPTPTVTIAKAPTSGDGQHATVETALALPLQVKVTEDGAPQVGTVVVWTGTGGSVVTPAGVTNADGIATATVTVGTVSGNDTVRAGLVGANGSPVRFIVVADAGPASKLSFTTAPTNVLHGGFFSPVVRATVQDSHGNKVPDATNAVTLAITTNPAGGTLTGGGPIAAVAGVAAFPTLSIDQIGNGYVLTASATGLTSAASTAFNVTATPPDPTTIGVTVGSTIQFKSVRNNSINPAVDTLAVGGTVTWTKAGGSHNVESTGAPDFPSSYGAGSSLTVMAATYQATFNTAGTYHYDCGIHKADMTGRVLVR